eukprot:6687096-Ditylum_brightwellii.AAC.2
MPARLNVAADPLATNYSIQHGIPCKEVPRMDINCAQLCTKNGVISSHYSKKIRDIVTTKDLRDHIKEKRGWSDEIFDSVDWPTYQYSKNRFHHHDSQIIKLTHNILPTAQHKKYMTRTCVLNSPFATIHLSQEITFSNVNQKN